MDNMKNVLHMDNVTMQFGGVVAVNGLSLDVNEHEIVALIGPNGAGKTTAFNCVTGIYQPTYGSVSFHGEIILADTPQGKMRRLSSQVLESMERMNMASIPPPIPVKKEEITKESSL